MPPVCEVERLGDVQVPSCWWKPCQRRCASPFPREFLRFLRSQGGLRAGPRQDGLIVAQGHSCYEVKMTSMQLILRSINTSRSAYASVTFYNTFFNGYDVFGTSVVQAGVLVKVRCCPVLLACSQNFSESMALRSKPSCSSVPRRLPRWRLS